MEEPQIVRKGEFAELLGVTAGRISQLIAEKKLRPPALVGEGRAARIVVPLARQQLKEALDPAQRFGLNGITTRLDAPPAPPRAPVVAIAPIADPAPIDDTVETKIKAEKLRQAQLMTSRLEEEDRARRGVYVEVAAVRAEMTRLVGDMLKIFEGWLPNLASDFVAEFKIPPRDALHRARKSFVRAREQASQAAAASAARQSKVVSDDETQPTSVQ
jgi:hypothetical protein